MRTLPLYPQRLQTPLEDGQRLAIDDGCRRCGKCDESSVVCMPAEASDVGAPSGATLLVIDAVPTSVEVRSARPFMSSRGLAVRKLVAESWNGTVVYDYAQKCQGELRDGDFDADSATACSPYMRDVFDSANPDRVILVGPDAARAALGRYVPPQDTRKAYSWVKRADGKLIPAFALLEPQNGRGNKFLQKFMQEDFAWACTVDVSKLLPSLDDAVFHIVDTEEDALAAVAELSTHDWVAFDCETAGKMFSDFFDVPSVSITPAGSDTAYVWGRQAMESPRIRQPMLDLLSSPSMGTVGANWKYDALTLKAAFGIDMRETFVLDVQLTRSLQLPGCLKPLAVMSELVGMGGYKQDFAKLLQGARDSIAKARKKSSNNRQISLLREDPVLVAAMANPDDEKDAYAYGLIPSPELERYNARDTIATSRLAIATEGHVGGFKLLTDSKPARNIWRGVVKKLPAAYTQIEAWGIAADRAAIQQFNAAISARVATAQQRFRDLGFNPESPAQKAAYLYGKLRLRNPKDKTGKSRSVDKKVLKLMKDQHPVVADLIEYGRIAKLKSSYGTLDRFIRADGRIHPSFKPDGTATGRLSLGDPGLHQIPREEDGSGNDDGRLIKQCFTAPPGRLILALDQSQIEYRCAAAISQDEVMRSMFLSGDDFHMNTARLIAPLYWKIDPSEVAKNHRSEAKAFSFGLLYGMSDKTIASNLGISLQRAQELRATIMGKWTSLAAWIAEQIRIAERYGYTASVWHGELARIRWLVAAGNLGQDDISSGARHTAINGAFNSPIQGWASDIVQYAVAELVDWLLRSDEVDAKLILTVHDSIMFEVAEDDWERLRDYARGVMTSFDLWNVPLVADAEKGTDWGHMKKAG